MATRLLLLAGLLLGLVTPPSVAGEGQHCRDHVGAATTIAPHETGSTPHHHPAGDGEHRCPPVQCATAAHCAPSGLALASLPAELLPALAASEQGTRSPPAAVGRTLQPPTPPPDSPA